MSCRAPEFALGLRPRLVRPILLALAGLLSSASPAAAAPSPATQALWRHATAAVRAAAKGQYTLAIRHAAAARAARGRPELDALVGVAALAAGRAKLAKGQLDAAIARKSHLPEVFYWAGRAELALGRRRAALERWEQGLTIGSHDDALQVAYATLAGRSGKTKVALEALEALARRRSNLLDASLWPTPRQGAVSLLRPLLRGFPYQVALARTEGHLYFETGAVGPAMRAFSAVLRLRKGDSNALQMLARCFARLGAKALAKTSAENALLQSPGSALAQWTLGELLLAEGGAVKRASALLEKAAAQRPREPRLLLLCARACAEAQKPACARRYFGYALRRQRNLAAAHFGIGLLAQQESKRAQAKLAFDRAMTLDPGKPRYYQAAAHLANLSGNKARARYLLGAGRRAAKVLAPLRLREGRLLAHLARLRRALGSCGCGEIGQRCRRAGVPACGAASKAVGGAAGLFLAAHRALRDKRTKDARRLLRRLLPALRASKLILRDPKVFIGKGRAVDGRRYEVRKLFPVAIVGKLPAGKGRKVSN